MNMKVMRVGYEGVNRNVIGQVCFVMKAIYLLVPHQHNTCLLFSVSRDNWHRGMCKITGKRLRCNFLVMFLVPLNYLWICRSYAKRRPQPNCQFLTDLFRNSLYFNLQFL